MRASTVAGALACALALAPVAMGQPASRVFTPEDHYRLRSASDVQLSPDGATIAFVVCWLGSPRRSPADG